MTDDIQCVAISVQYRLQRSYETPWTHVDGTWTYPGTATYQSLLSEGCKVLNIRDASSSGVYCLHDARHGRSIASEHDLEALLDDVMHEAVVLSDGGCTRTTPGRIELELTIVKRYEAVAGAPLGRRDTIQGLCSALSSVITALRTEGPSVVVVYGADTLALYPYRELLSYPGYCGPHDAAQFSFIRYVAATTSDVCDTNITIYWPSACVVTSFSVNDCSQIDWSLINGIDSEKEDADDMDEAAIARLIKSFGVQDTEEESKSEDCKLKEKHGLNTATEETVRRLSEMFSAQPTRNVWCAMLAMSRRYGLPALGRTLPRNYVNDSAYSLPDDYFPPFTVVPVFAGSEETEQQEQQRIRRQSGLANALAALTQTSSAAATELPESWCAANATVFGAHTACGLNLLHCAALRDRGAWLELFAKWGRSCGAGIDDLGGCCALTPLAIAAKCGNMDALRACRKAGANPDARTGRPGQKDEGATALFLAAREGRVDVCAYLVLACDADVNASLTDGSSPLAAARVPAIAKLLLSHGARVAGLVTPAGNMLWEGSDSKHSAELLKLYLDYGGAQFVNTRAGYMDATPLAKICGSCTVRDEQSLICARLLVENGANVFLADKNGNTPLQTLLTTSWPVGKEDLTSAFVELLLDAAERAAASATEAEKKRRVAWWPMTPRNIVDHCCSRQDWDSLEVFARHGVPLSSVLKRTISKAVQFSGCSVAVAERIFNGTTIWEQKERDREAQALQGIDDILRDMGEDPEKYNGKNRTKGRKTKQKKKDFAVDGDGDDEIKKQQLMGDGRAKAPEKQERTKKETKSEIFIQNEGTVAVAAAAAAVPTEQMKSDDDPGWVKANQLPPPTRKQQTANNQKKKGKKPQPQKQQQQQQQQQQPQKLPVEQPKSIEQSVVETCAVEDVHAECRKHQAELEKKIASLEAELEASRAREQELTQQLSLMQSQREKELNQQHQKPQSGPLLSSSAISSSLFPSQQQQPFTQSWSVMYLDRWLEEHENGRRLPPRFPPFQHPQAAPPLTHPLSAEGKKVALSTIDKLLADDDDNT